MRNSREVFELLHTGIANAGIDADAVHRRLLDAGHLLGAHGRISVSMHVAFWRTLEELTGDPEIGLHLCPHLPVYRGRVLEYLFLSSPDYEQGLLAAFEYQKLVSDAFHPRLIRDESGVRIAMHCAMGGAPELRHTEICLVYSFLQVMGKLTNDGINPLRIRLGVEPVAPPVEYERVFAAAVDFIESDSEIWLDPALLQRRSPHRDPGLLQLHKQYADAQLARQDRQDLLNDVSDYLARQFRKGPYRNRSTRLKLAEVAGEFGVSERRLRFVLSEAGTSFRRLLQEVQFAYACRMLRESDLSLENVAHNAGFVEPSSFYRAFKRWSGLTPRQYRESGAGRP